MHSYCTWNLLRCNVQSAILNDEVIMYAMKKKENILLLKFILMVYMCNIEHYIFMNLSTTTTTKSYTYRKPLKVNIPGVIIYGQGGFKSGGGGLKRFFNTNLCFYERNSM